MLRQARLIAVLLLLFVRAQTSFAHGVRVRMVALHRDGMDLALQAAANHFLESYLNVRQAKALV